MARLVCPYWTFGLLRHIVPLDTLIQWAWRRPQRPHDPGRDTQTLARLIKVGHLFGGRDRNCLQRSLVLYRELSRNGADPSLVIGFSRTSGPLAGHAWVEIDGRPFGEPTAVEAIFSRTCAFGPGGRLVDAGDETNPSRAARNAFSPGT